MSRLLLLVSILISLILAPLFVSVQAATPVTITLEPALSQYKPGDLITIPMRIHTQGEGIYSLQTDISFPADQLEVSSIDTTSSVFPLQVINTYSPGKISLIRGSFSPINTATGLVATIQLKALKSGTAELVFDPTTVALNTTGTNQTTALGTIIQIATPAPSITPTPIPSPSIPPSPTPSPSPSPVVLPLPSVIPSPTIIPSPSSGMITIYAAGTPVDGVYPNLSLQIRNIKNNKWQTVKEFNNIDSLLHELIYKHPSKVEPKDIRVRFTNDRYLPKKGQDRNLYVDRINVDGIDIQTEKVSTYSEGSWSSKNGCAAGFKRSEWLHCNGYFEYR